MSNLLPITINNQISPSEIVFSKHQERMQELMNEFVNSDYAKTIEQIFQHSIDGRRIEAEALGRTLPTELKMRVWTSITEFSGENEASALQTAPNNNLQSISLNAPYGSSK